MPHGRRRLPSLVAIFDPVLRAPVMRVDPPGRSITPAPSLPRWALLLGVGLLAIQGAISLLNVATWDGIQAMEVIDLNTEANVPTWFASMLLASIAVGAAGLAIDARRDRRTGGIWLVVAAGFLWLSLEEVAGIHERLGYHFGAAGSVSDWTLLYLPAMAAGAAVVLLAARDLPRRRAVMAGVGLVLFGGVLAAETVSLWTGGTLVQTLIEENAEVVGEVLILLALSSTLLERAADQRLVASPAGESLAAGRHP